MMKTDLGESFTERTHVAIRSIFPFFKILIEDMKTCLNVMPHYYFRWIIDHLIVREEKEYGTHQREKANIILKKEE